MTHLTANHRCASLLAKLDRQGSRKAILGGKTGARTGYELLHRVMDLVVGLPLLVICLPLMLVVAAFIRLTSEGPVIFKQIRAGKDGKPFVMYKFRTMHEGAEDDRHFVKHLNQQGGPVFKSRCDPRLTGIGGFLRRSSIDELPQLINVLAGHMSLVGPRPLWLPEAEKTTGVSRLRTKVKPGLTCLWQISGRSELSYENWVLLDLFYINHRSILLDVLILFQTIPAVLSARGAY